MPQIGQVSAEKDVGAYFPSPLPLVTYRFYHLLVRATPRRRHSLDLVSLALTKKTEKLFVFPQQ